MFKPRKYQTEISDKGVEILKKYKIVYYGLEMRLGKTHISMMTAKKYGAKNLLFITKKKAIHSIELDYDHHKEYFDITVVNYESVHKIEGEFDLCVVDEAHTIATYPKPSLRYKRIKEKYGHLPFIFLSGTPAPESYSQFFHQFTVSKHSVWSKYTNFYKWCSAGYVKVKQQKVSHGRINDYSTGNYDKIMEDIEHLMLTYQQKDAGFTTSVEEIVLHVKMQPQTYSLIERLQKDKVIEGKHEIILGDTAVKEMRKVQQLYSGTVKFESGVSKIIDDTKARFIKEKFKGKKLAIFYLFQAEYRMLKQVFGEKLTNDLQVFNNSDKHIALQIVSGREGISLAKADNLIYLNIDFSAVSYYQSKERLTTKDRLNNTVYWVFAEGGLEDKIYKTVIKKKDFTTKIYEKGI